MESKLKLLLSARFLPLYLAGLGVLLSSPSLFLGWQTDDYFHRAALVGVPEFPEISRTPFELFAFLKGDIEYNRRLMDQGAMPWWSAPDLKLAFFRPVTGFTHWLDYQLFPEKPFLMHHHSLLWLAAFIAAATLLYRRLLLPSWVAGLAGLLFALDDAHGIPAVWIANRNSLIGAFFGILAIVFHDKGRRDGWRWGPILAPVALALGLFSNEGTVAVGAYLVGYTIFLEEGSWRKRVGSITSSLMVIAAWYGLYCALGYGAAHSQMYLEPGEDPGRFLRAVVDRAPLLLFGQWFLPSDLHLILSVEAKRFFWVVTVAAGIVLLALLYPLVRRDRLARFWAFGMILSIVPVCATMPGDRLLFFVGLGGMGLLAQLLVALSRVTRQSTRRVTLAGDPRGVAPRPIFSSKAAGLIVIGVFLVLHLLLAPVSLLATSAKLEQFSKAMDIAAGSLPADEAVRQQTVMVVNAPTAFLVANGPIIQYWAGRPAPLRIRTLGTGLGELAIERRDDRTLVFRPSGGYFAEPGALPGDPPASLMYSFTPFDRMYYGGEPFERGTEIALPDPVVSIEETTPEGRPSTVSFRFERPLEDPAYRWLKWEKGVYAPFDLPEIGSWIIAPPVTLSTI